MKKFFVFLSGALFLLASCVNETENNGQISDKLGVREDGTTLVRVSLGDDSRTYFGAHDGTSYSVYWSDTDAIQINGANSTGISVDGSKKSSAEFTIGASLEYPYCAVYPAELASGFVADSVMVTLPAVQQYTEGTFDPAAAVMLGYAAEGEVGFKCAMSFLKVKVAGGSDSDPIAFVRVRSNVDLLNTDGDYARQPMSGEFIAKFSANGNRIYRRITDDSSVTLDCGNGVAQGTDMFIAIPPQTYSKGINIFIVDANGDYQEVVSTKSFTAEAGVVYNTDIAFNGGKTWQGPGIYTVADWNSFAAQISLNAGCEEFKDGQGVYNIYEDLSAKTVMRIGGVSVGNSIFAGVLNGNGHSITTTTMAVPLFTYITGTVMNLRIGGSKPSINTAGWGTCQMALELREGAVIDNVVAEYTVTAPNTSSGTSRTYYYGLFRDILSGATVQNCVQKSEFIVPVSDASTGDCLILPIAYGNAGTVKDCAFEGSISTPEAMSQKVITAPFFKNTATLDGFVNSGNISVESSVGVGAAGVCVFGGGYIHNAVNEGTITVTASPVANGKSFRVAGIATYGDGDDSNNCGRFYGCANHGNITLYKSTTPILYRSSVGGIIADIRYGAYTGSEDNTHNTIDSSVNDGYLKVYEPNTVATTSNAVPMFLGGIVGCALNNSGTSSGAIIFTKSTNTDSFNGVFLVVRDNCSNTGTLEMASASPSPSNTGVSGARLNYVGGIAGFTYGLGNSNTSGASNAHYAVLRGTQNGIIKVGSSKNGCIAAGGIVGGCCYTKVEAADVELVDYQATAEKTDGADPVYRGTLGGVIGWVVKYSNIGASGKPVNAILEDNTNLICSSSTGVNDVDALKGYAGVTGGTSVHRTATKETHSVTIAGAPTYNGETVTEDMCYGGGKKTIQ
ncbi:MAG: hypothetical protein J5764_05850 [Bacteroidales bacterium]|nr:hypothetical protein [Bacteroidales bacterium]